MSDFLIVGAGVSGCSAALELAREGHNILLIDEAPLAGGKVLGYGCKAAERCTRCGVCLALERVKEALEHPGIRFLPSTVVTAVSSGPKGGLEVSINRSLPAFEPRRCTGCGACRDACPSHAIEEVRRGLLVQYRLDPGLCLKAGGAACAACAAACPQGAIQVKAEPAETAAVHATLLAAGHEPFPAERRVRLGYGRVPGVLTGLDLEKRLREGSWRSPGPGQGLEEDGRAIRDVAFIQCVGSRDAREGRDYCSEACCAYALRMARLLKHRDPECAITIYAIDVQNMDKEFSAFRQELLAAGVRFVRGLPYDIEKGGGGKVRLRLAGADGEGEEESSVKEHDAAVLSIGMVPCSGAGYLAERFGLDRDGGGFLRRPSSPRFPMVFTAGTCAGPRGIVEAMASGRAAALEMLKAAGGGSNG